MTLDKYIAEGRSLGKSELLSCVRELRKFGHYKNALEVSVRFGTLLGLQSSELEVWNN